MIEIYSFEEWDALQDPEKTVEWGSSDRESLVAQNTALYKEAPLHIRRMFYAEYVHRSTNPITQS